MPKCDRKVFIQIIFNVRMIDDFLKEVLFIVAGKQADGMADLLNNNKHVNEFSIAKKLGITINQARNILYKIADKGLVSSIRKKDKRKGWYTYFWKIEALKALEFFRDSLLKKIEQLNNQIKSRESKQFYLCEKCNLEFNEENALLYDFTCRECGNVFVLKDNSKVIKDFKKELVKIEGDLKAVDQEIEKERAKLGKIKIKGIGKKEVKKKKIRKQKIKVKQKKKKIEKARPSLVGLKKKAAKSQIRRIVKLVRKKTKIKKTIKRKIKKASKKGRLSVAGLKKR